MSRFEIQTWVDDRLMPAVAPLIADDPSTNKDKWRVAFQSAYLKDRNLAAAIANNPNGAFLALTKCAQLGLSPDPALQHFALVPFRNDIQGLVMWRGWVSLAMDSGRVVDGTISAEVIYKQEEQALRDAGIPLMDPATKRVNHTPDVFARDDWTDKDIIGAYAEAKIVDGPWVSMVMSRKQIQKRLDMGAGAAAKKWFPEMCKAKVLGALMRSGKVPLTERTRRTIGDSDEEEVKVVQAEVVPTAPTALPPRPAAAPTGGKILFDEVNKDPFPSEERQASNLVKAIEGEFARQAVPEEAQAALIGSVAADATLDQLTEQELQFVFDKLTDGGKKAQA